jgi:formylglycine-generating enzyme required for sulfatase activity
MARLPTTVNQFEAFIADGGYGENPEDSKAKSYWDEQGWAWRHSSASFVHHLNGTDQHELLKLRIGNLRSLPWDWARQQRVGSHAVTGINWFEARAYARWLNEQFQKCGLLLDNLPGYAVRLPSEWQWELAARGTNPQRWPWGDDESFANQRANLRNSGIDHPNVFGCFAPNISGLCDLAGNVHEWQDGLFFKAGVSEKDYERLLLTNSEFPKGQVQAVNDTRFQHLPRTYLHLLTNDSYLFDLVAARGGSYEVNSRIAACSFRDFYMADFWLLTLGFRIALSKV